MTTLCYKKVWRKISSDFFDSYLFNFTYQIYYNIFQQKGKEITILGYFWLFFGYFVI